MEPVDFEQKNFNLGAPQGMEKALVETDCPWCEMAELRLMMGQRGKA